MNSYFSRKITSASFLMSLLVVLIHSENLPNGMHLGFGSPAEALEKLLSFDLGVAAVPIFFLLSGALLFNFDLHSGFGVLRKKLCRRISSVLVPYLIWNTIYTAISLAGREGRQMILSGQWEQLGIGILRGILLADNCYAFWYLKNLLVLLALSPLILLLLRSKYLCLAGVILAGGATALGCPEPDWLHIRSIFFFLSGAWLMQYGSAFFLKSDVRRRCWAAYAGVGVLVMFLNERSPALDSVLNLSIPFAVWLALPELDDWRSILSARAAS